MEDLIKVAEAYKKLGWLSEKVVEDLKKRVQAQQKKLAK